MNNIIIVGDSTCDLPPAWRKKLNVLMMPLPVNVGTQPRLDMANVFPEEIFEYYDKTGELCTTSAPNALDYVEFWNNVRKDNPTCEILHFHISSEMTATHNICCEATKEFEKVWSIDTKSVSIGVALLIMQACRMRDEGKTAGEIYDAIEAVKTQVKVGFLVKKVEYLRKGGRCTSLQALGANLLNLHPAINMADGKLRPGKKYRGQMKLVYDNLINDLIGNKNLEIEDGRVFIANTSPNEEIDSYLVDTVMKVRPDMKETILSQPSCSICVHCGPNTVGLAFIAK